jgi:hypothetical protein
MIIIGTSLMWNENPFNLQDEALSKFKFVSDKNGQPPTTATLSTDLLDLVPDFTNPFSAGLTDKHVQNTYNQELNFRAHARKTPSASNFCPRALAYRTATDICIRDCPLSSLPYLRALASLATANDLQTHTGLRSTY